MTTSLEEEELLRLSRQNRASFSGGREPISEGRLKKGDGTLLLIPWNGTASDIASEGVNSTSLFIPVKCFLSFKAL